MKHCIVDLGSPVHYVDFGGSGRPIVLVHGLGGSHVNWAAVGPALAAHGRVVAIDLAGHGRTRSVGRNARVASNQRLLGAFLQAVAGEPAVLMGNSMGGYLSMAVAAAQPDRVSSLVLVDPACPVKQGVKWDRRVFYLFMGYALPVVGGLLMRRRRRMPPEQMVRETLSLCCVDPSLVAPAVYDAHVEMARERQSLGRAYGRDFLDAQRSLMAQLLRRETYLEMVASIRAPALIVQGDRDRLVNVESARALAAARSDWRIEVLEGVGHVPQLEVPERFLEVVEPWLAERVAA
jgi:pimeloyl-ACP methyl ester carboxylesterase